MGAGDEPAAENGVREIGSGLIETGDGVALRHGTHAEPGELRKDEPHPVRTFAAVTKFGGHACMDGFLRLDKAGKIERIVSHSAKFHGRARCRDHQHAVADRLVIEIDAQNGIGTA